MKIMKFIMNEVTNQNFNQVYPYFEATLKNANFIAIDGEFTGITVDDVKNSLFDSMKERYEKSREIVHSYAIIQFGIAAFQRVPDMNEYTVQAFNFFLLPKSTPWKKRQFVWHTGALEFLASYEFDFNKLIYNGISSLNETDEAILQQKLRENVLLRNIEHYISRNDYNTHKDYISQVTDWLDTASEESSFKIETPTCLLQYLMHKELRNHLSNVWTLSGENSVTVMKVTPTVRKILEQREGSILENVLIDSYMGFSKVFKLLVTLKKPVIAHNAFLDLMFMYQQFYKPLPPKYSEFKRNMHQLFPTIYDTKFLSYELKEFLQMEDKWKFNSLSSLVDYFTKEQGVYLTAASPVIKFATQLDSEKSNAEVSPMYHTAGWDAYCTGYIYLKIAYTFAAKHWGSNLIMKYFTHTELMSSVKNYANCINIIRGNALYMRLDGLDPESTRPKWLYVKTLMPQPMSALQVAEKMSTFGAVDVKEYTSKRMLVAVANHRSARAILQYFQQNKELYVAPYSPIRHSRSVQLVFWSSLVVSSGLFAWMLQKNS